MVGNIVERKTRVCLSEAKLVEGNVFEINVDMWRKDLGKDRGGSVFPA